VIVVRAVAQVFRACLVASAFFWFWLGAVVFAWTVCPLLVLVVRDEPRRWRICQRIVKAAYRTFHAYMELLTLVELRVVGEATARPPGALVIVANHPTLVDVTAILSTYDDVCCIVKESLVNNFFVGRLLRTCGHVATGDSDGMSGADTLAAIRRRLDADMAVLFFPEGTRSPPSGMRAFRRGGFEVAARAGVPIWPVLVTCRPSALSKGLPIWKHPERVARLRLEPGDLIDPPGDGRAACRHVEAVFRERLALDVAGPAVAASAKNRYSAPAAAP
jgi:1-acyl-sn-glycerol-3-phosphate acyltransferase